ncbi:MAG TPA: hypothetical protein VHD56_16955 [Tepidisphaeraceae bacterium]|nr:hypothetical protein [Tepidisphaeraceae bacterium]
MPAQQDIRSFKQALKARSRKSEDAKVFLTADESLQQKLALSQQSEKAYQHPEALAQYDGRRSQHDAQVRLHYKGCADVPAFPSRLWSKIIDQNPAVLHAN